MTVCDGCDGYGVPDFDCHSRHRFIRNRAVTVAPLPTSTVATVTAVLRMRVECVLSDGTWGGECVRYTHNQEGFLKSNVYINVCCNRIKDTARNPESACFGRGNTFCVVMKSGIHHKSLRSWCAGAFCRTRYTGKCCGKVFASIAF